MKIGVYGGTFNPPHLGHLEAARCAVEALGLDKLLLVPAALPPHKDLPENTPAPEYRVAMLEKTADALRLPEVVQVSTLELDREGRSYTADTLRQVHEMYPTAQLWLLVGTDMFLTLHQWSRPEEILKLARICAFSRAGGTDWTALAEQKAFLEQTYDAQAELIPLPQGVEVSSSQLREQLKQGQGGQGLLPAVYGHILMHGLYGTHADLKHLNIPELRACSYSMVLQKRVNHIRGTEEEAVRLAKRWGADETLARRAGILHDCTKYLDLSEQLALCQQYGVELDELEKRTLKLLHSKTGACIAKYVFGEPDEVYWAIYYHTTGKADMTMLEKILYLADYIEPNRNFDGLEEMRRLAYEDIDAALILGMDMTIQDMESRGYQVHCNTLQARNWLRGDRE